MSLTAFTVKGIDEELLIRFKVCAIEGRKSILESVSEALREYVDKRRGKA